MQKKKNLSRRKFLGSCAACAAGISTLSFLTKPTFNNDYKYFQNNDKKIRISLIFAHPSSKEPCWPNIGYDFEARKRELLKKFKEKFKEVEFLPVTARKDEDATKILQTDNQVDGYIVYLVGCLWGNVPEIIASSGKPTIFVDDLFAGTGKFLTGYSKVKRQGLKVIGISSSKFEDVVKAVQCIVCIKKLSLSTMLVIGGKPDTVIEKNFGTKILGLEFAEINKEYKKVDPLKVKQIAEKWINEAEKIVEPSHQDIEKSSALYLAMCNLMKKYNARAITINCLGGFYGGHLSAYPCLGFMQLDNDGLVGGCEADQKSTITKLLMSYLTGRPGFISDPVIDTATNRIIYAHCVAPTKVFGPYGSSNPYHIRNHSEDRKGACNRSLMPLNQIVTTIKFDAEKKMVIMHQGKTVANIDEDKACRNKLAVEVMGDIHKLLKFWDEWGWHRVTFFGEFKQQVYQIATLLGFNVIEEA